MTEKIRLDLHIKRKALEYRTKRGTVEHIKYKEATETDMERWKNTNIHPESGTDDGIWHRQDKLCTKTTFFVTSRFFRNQAQTA